MTKRKPGAGGAEQGRPTGPRGPARWIRDLCLGARYAVAGGREGLLRTALTAVGVGLGVALLLLVASVPSALADRHARETARSVGVTGEFRDPAEPDARRGPDTLLYQEVRTDFHDKPVTGGLLAPDGPDAPRPPGVDRLPEPGEMVVSPALAALLASDRGALLRDRFAAYRTVGTIGHAGLVGPDELLYYAGSDRIGPATGAKRVDRFGYDEPDVPMSPVLVVLTVLACVVLLTPVAVFIGTSVRFGGAGRDRRLAALRLIGADLRMVRRIAAGEALTGAVLGLGVGAAVFLALREYARDLTIRDTGIFPSDVMPTPWMLALIVVAVPACAVGVTLFTLRGVAVEPLGVVRGTAPRRRRLWWRLLVPALGAVLLTPALGRASGRLPGMPGLPVDTWQVATGAALLLLGVTALLPWGVEAFVARLRGGPPSWQLAVRRLQLKSGPAARAVSGITVAVAGAIAVQMVFTGVRGEFDTSPEALATHSQLTGSYAVGSPRQVHDWVDRLRRTEGVRAASGHVERYVGKDGAPNTVTSVLVGDCATLAELADIGSCRDGDVFLGRSDDPGHADAFGPGTKVVAEPYTEGPARPYRWTVPESARVVRTRPGPTGEHPDGVLATPGAVDAAALPDARTRLSVRTEPGDPDAIERVRNTAAGIDPALRIDRRGGVVKDDNYPLVHRGLLLGAGGMLALIGAGLLVTTLEQLRERRRMLAALVAVGTPRRTLAWSVLWQTAIPVLLGMAIAVAGGLGLGWAVLRLTGARGADWWAFLPVAGAGVGLIGLVTLATLPVLLRMTRPEGLRTE
ncbi:ABC transporter permease [Streptomyces huiliensis]|uniref:ABC transporter permease n=1 Tax=Streptomyces huiliensis TaxID=2876027 RepID=UPI001CC1BACD|nr:ABC transporter permease [Streptomyces huiliensis]